MIILGIDPGIATIGYGLIEKIGNKYKVINYGHISTPPKKNLPSRLKIIYDKLDEIIKEYNPDEVAVEELFFNKNVKTALAVGHGRGVCLLVCENNGLKAYEYTPLQVKQSVVGYGRAVKSQVQHMVKIHWNVSKIPKPYDVADGHAIAICHGNSNEINKRIESLF